MPWKKARKEKIDIASRKNFRPPKKINPVWDLYRDGITYSTLSKFLICRERFRLSTVEGWTESGIKNVLEFGSVFHSCLEWVIAGKPLREIDRCLTNYEKGRKNLKPDERQDLDLILGTIKILFPLYVEFWSKQDRQKVYVAQEQQFNVTHTLPFSKKTIRLRGRWDAIFRADSPSTNKKGTLWLQENKTKSNIDEEGLQGGLSQDLQTMLYAYTISREFNEYPTEVCYNVIRRPGIRPKKSEKLTDYFARLQDDVVGRPQHYFMRWETSLSSQDVDTWVTTTLNPILEQVVEWWESIKHNPFDPWHLSNGDPNPKHFLRPFGVYDGASHGNRGDFFDLLTRKSTYGLFRRKDPFPELVAE